ncbi:hypothetical protein DFH09DRAFT_1088398 [Mycena vulgaris]|nr:hypothetical protein DFH09DRAFT_1088398 [Mycena vulgaris]
MSTTVPPSAFNWGDPTVTVSTPPTRVPIPTNITPWDNLQFTPFGAYEVCRHLRAQMDAAGHFNRSRQKFLVADIAYVAAGTSDDGRHMVMGDLFFDEFHHLYDSLPPQKLGKEAWKVFAGRIRRLVFDLVTMWDPVYGGTTIVIHANGTTVPNAPLVLEQLKAYCYIPPTFVADHPETHPVIASIVQTFIEHISIPTAADWLHRARRIWPMSQTGHLTSIVLPTALVPPATSSRSSYYLFSGRPMGSLPAPPPPVPTSTAAPPPEDKIHVFQLTQEMEHTLQTSQLNKELDEMALKVQRLEGELRAAKDRASTPPLRIAPPAYTHSTPSRLGSQSAVTSPWAQGSSVRGTSAIGPLTAVFLAKHALSELTDALSLIVRVYRLWNAELNRLSGLPADLTEELLAVMDADVESRLA